LLNNMKRGHLKIFFKEYIEGTPEKAVVADQKMLLCRLTLAVAQGIEIHDSIRGVYVTSRCLKHLFDKKPAEEFLFIIDHLHEIARYPDKIYLNKEAKRGCFCFVKIINGVEYFCSLEIKKTPPAIYGEAGLGISEYGEEKEIEEIQVATAFRMRKKYIKNYTLLWDWGDGNPHRSALDTPKESTNAPQ